MPDSPVTALPSSTILLIRDASPSLEVFMVQRNHRIDFAEGALVFPGGKVDEADADASLAARCRGAEGLDDDARTLRIAAVRETYEESGVLLARPAGESELITAARLADIDASHREALQNGERTFAEFAASESLELALDLLVPYAHWITPEFMPKRFDTWFFLAKAPADHAPIHDGGESVDSLWTTVEEAVDLEKSGKRTIIFPTLMNLKKLGESTTVAQALESARNRPIVTVLPKMEKEPDGKAVLVLPEEAGYEIVRAPMGVLR